MTTRKELRKKIKAPDLLQEEGLKFFDFVSHNAKQVTLIVVLLLVAVGIGLGVSQYLDGQATEVKEQLSAIDMTFAKEALAAEDERKVLRDQLSTLEDKKDATADDKKKIEELQAKITGIKANHSKSAAEYQKFFVSHLDTPEGWAAGIKFLGAKGDQATPEERASVLSKVVSNSQTHPFYQTYGRFMLISALEDQQKWDDALKVVDQLAARVDKSLQPKVLLAKGRLLLAKGDASGAQTALSSLISDHKDSPEAMRARGLMAVKNMTTTASAAK